MTQHLHRVHIVCPAARCATLNGRIKADLDPQGGDWLTPRLSATGEPPYTYAECNAALTNRELKLVLAYLGSQGGQSLPADWDARTRAERKAWLASARDAIDASIGVYLSLVDNDAATPIPSFLDVLTLKGVRGVSGERPIEAAVVEGGDVK